MFPHLVWTWTERENIPENTSWKGYTRNVKDILDEILTIPNRRRNFYYFRSDENDSETRREFQRRFAEQ